MIALRAALAVLILPGTVVVLIPGAILWTGIGAGVPEFGTGRWAGLLPVTLGAAVGLACVVEFVTRGLGTPAPWDPPRRLVVTGLYRHSRNPMYIGVLLVLAGEAIFLESLALFLYALLAAIAFHVRVVLYEEPMLRESFGREYEEYCARVPRWIHPRAAGEPGDGPGEAGSAGQGPRGVEERGDERGPDPAVGSEPSGRPDRIDPGGAQG